MTLVPFNKYDIDHIPTKQQHFEIGKVIINFIGGPHDCVEVVDYPHASAESCRSSIASSMHFMGIVGVKVRMRGRRVFLIKER